MKTKICMTCKARLQLSKFYSNGFYKTTKKYKPNCAVCEYKRQGERLATIIVEHFGSAKCQKCGYDKCFAALECHHTGEHQKDLRVSQMDTYSKKRIIKELKKCILLCANCHRELHHKV